MNRFVKCVVAFFLLLLHCGVFAAGHNEFVNLYPDCEDNEPSKIYEPNEWPKGLRTPLFPNGGDIEFLRYIYDQLGKDYPDVVDSTVAATDDQPEKVYRAKGVVMVHITVDRCGKAVNPVVMESVNDAYDKAALKLMENLPIFKPGALDGVRVKVGMLVPVKFSRSHLPTKYEWDSGGNGWSGGDDSSSDSSDDSGSSDDWGSGWGDPW
ncbi:MAG: energy transducer TonB [Paludibacteraceae bacterium]|nr:energy transducer TonB [Paludibacteraceae bacterium]